MRRGEPEGAVLVEAESFDDLGGWVLDQQFMSTMGSPCLLAHGLGRPVKDAVTGIDVPAAGEYRLWVRTRDWVGPWETEGPGRFQVTLDGTPAPVVFGTESAKWHWQDGGTVELTGQQARVALHDLTGFEARCDALLLCADAAFVPPNEADALASFRDAMLPHRARIEEAGAYDLVVAGGGVAGMCAAVSASRLGLRVALVQDRPVPGGNNSSEVRVRVAGRTRVDPYGELGKIVEELTPPDPPEGTDSTEDASAWQDAERTRALQLEPNLRLWPGRRVVAVEHHGGRLTALVAADIRSGKRLRFTGSVFADCTGDAEVGFLAEADVDMTHTGHMGPSNLWRVADTGATAPFPRCPWALDLSDRPFPGRGTHTAQWARPGLQSLGRWFWESGLSWDPISEAELMRDWNFMAMYGAWDALKNVDGLYPTYELSWAAYIAGKRESRRLLGEVVLTQEDIVSQRHFRDGCIPCTWALDLHRPHAAYQPGFEGREFITYSYNPADFKRPYWAPYRCLYSRNVDNLFMAGRNISVSHEALGTVRVMGTTGMMGEVIGMAASICGGHDCAPADVYGRHLTELQNLLRRGVPGRKA